MKVAAYTFHDAFLQYRALLHGVLPRRLDPVDSRKPEVAKRFAKAAIGWVRYKPLLSYVTDRSSYEATVESMESTFRRLGPGLRTYFKTEEFSRLLPELLQYTRKVQEHNELFEQTKEVWRKALPWAKAHALQE